MKKCSIFAASLAFLASAALVGCSTSTDDLEGITNDNSPKLKFITRSEGAAEAEYAHKAYLVSGTTISDAKSAANAAGLTAFSVEPGTYTVYASAANSETNLTFTGIEASKAIADARIKVTDMTAQIPELMVGKSAAVAVSDQGGTASVELKRVVASVEVSVSGLSAIDANTITLTIGNMYDQVDLDGNLSKSGAAFASKVITLTKNTASGVYEGNAIVMPTDVEASAVVFTYNINGTNYSGTPKVDGAALAKIAANGKYTLATTITTSGTKPVSLTSSVSYKAWDASVVLADSFTIAEETPEKTWTSAALPIGGKANGCDNFWASSSLEGQSDSNLFDGVKDGGYWGPDVSWDGTPTWYIKLGKSCEGIAIDYWNKSGGAGGQKIKTMDIYGSNLEGDYGGGNTSWVKITTFTSDKTTPTTDAGVQVSTGKIAFSTDGTTSYQYIKCVMTSRVSNTGESIADGDVNVGEVEVTTWSYK